MRHTVIVTTLYSGNRFVEMLMLQMGIFAAGSSGFRIERYKSQIFSLFATTSVVKLNFHKRKLRYGV